jgi:tetratricopeptide (TPR) repeat protein
VRAARKYTFFEILSCHLALPCLCSPYFYYFDLLVVNQHGPAVVPFESLRNTFAAGVLGAGRTLLILDETASAMGRLWCVFELAVSLQHNDCVLFEVILAPRHANTFRRQLVTDYESVVMRTINVDVEKAKAREAADETNIRRMLEETPGLGYLRANQLVIGAMKSWMIAVLRNALLDMTPEERVLSGLQFHASRFFKDLGLLDDALVLARGDLEAKQRCRLPGHKEAALVSMSNVVHVLKDLGQFPEAESLARKVLTTRRRLHGDRHPSTLTSIANLASVLLKLKLLPEAEALAHEALQTRLLLPGVDDPGVLNSKNQLAQILMARGKLEEAASLSSEALRGTEETFGNDHPNTLIAINNHAQLLEAIGRLEEAEVLTRKALATKRRIHGDQHPSTLISISNLTELLQAMNRLDEAEPLARDLLATSRRVLGDKHPDTLSRLNIAVALRKKFSLANAGRDCDGRACLPLR